MSKGERRGVLSEIEDMLRVNMTNEEIKEQFRHLLTDAEIEELIESVKATLSKPKEEQTSLNKNS